MDTRLTIETGRVDDIPVLVANMNKMGIEELVEEIFATHGNGCCHKHNRVRLFSYKSSVFLLFCDFSCLLRNTYASVN